MSKLKSFLIHSDRGVASLKISVTALLLMIAAFAGWATESLFILACIGGVVGFALGIAGLFQKKRRTKLFAILGMVISSPVILVAGFTIFTLASYPG